MAILWRSSATKQTLNKMPLMGVYLGYFMRPG